VVNTRLPAPITAIFTIALLFLPPAAAFFGAYEFPVAYPLHDG
jgi:hypothetical protein